MIEFLLSLPPIFALAWIVALLLGLTVHEFAHALVGKILGDDTAERLGRLSLNPLAHLDPLGAVLLITIGMGWAKPVPFNPNLLRHPLRDGMVIALAGPGANILLAALSAGAFHVIPDGMGALPAFLASLVFLNILLALFNLIPIHPLDGAKVADLVLSSLGWDSARVWLQTRGPFLLLVLVFLQFVTPWNPFYAVSFGANILAFFALGVPFASAFGVLN